ncbi:glycosyltransferase family 34 protein [Aplosporella prunicola CBS 121167]|uniref:Glycosyltransferase family 34 protein n=1 Tax=Aplosporella prunicola CBS 121167 TaxID=1176127 RepID=A0A6A6BQQ6_9PEZI|nr:glycosyltransferase family 34 protein [Aplosporella prunicola CBS 121167]KAF2146449.1 glycosyltransferase family 34 protein [Aplosporella prunicola CBS 121167]
MSLSRSPSPNPGTGWPSPGLPTPTFGDMSGRSSPMIGGANNVTWSSAQAKSAEVRGFKPRGNIFSRHMSRWSQSLPLWIHPSGVTSAEKEKFSRATFSPRRNGGVKGVLSWLFGRGRGLKLRLLLVLLALFFYMVFHITPLQRWYNHTSYLGGGSKFVILLGANVGGGVMEWKGAREWAIERDSVKNKRLYAEKWGYELEIVDMSTKKRYAHEWRESWEKVDTVRNAMHKYPDAEWFWWLDLNTFIMEPNYSLQNHIFNELGANTYRDINYYNPLNITHPIDDPWLDPLSRSVNGDGDPASINVIIPQDCGGFNLGSFFVRRSTWTDRLLDLWWDPVHYEQRHMDWEHKEQDAFEYMYANQPWVRPHVAFISQRKINSFPPGACNDNGFDPKIHYDEQERDFVVNMAGCEWGRDCWGEMYNYRELSNRLNRGPLQRLRAWWNDEDAKLAEAERQEQEGGEQLSQEEEGEEQQQ